MKKYVLALSVLLFISITKGKAQEKELLVIYDVIDKSSYGNDKKSDLRCYNGKVLCSSLFKAHFAAGVAGESMGNGKYKQVQERSLNEDFKNFKSRPDAYKNHVEGLMHFHEGFPYDKIIKEDMDLFKWTALTEYESILGYRCQKAKAEFRGRNYTAWFTTDLPFKAAPWKIHGLPGVVLKLETDDQFLKYTAIKLKVMESEGELKNPFEKRKSISWKQFSEYYTEQHRGAEKEARAYCAKNNRPYNPAMILKPRVEIIIDKLNRVSLQEMAKKIQEQAKH